MAETKHISLGELQAQVAQALQGAFPMPVWVAAEIAELRVNPTSGHCYLELVEKSGSGTSGVVQASARGVAWRGMWTSLSAYFQGVTGSPLAAGMKVLLKVVVSYHELYGLSLVISDIDPSYTLGDRERQRQQTIARLKADGVWDMNREVDFPYVVQRVAVVSSSGAAGWRDFVQELGRYPYRFEVTLFEAVMQGAATESSVVDALERIAARADDFDAVAVIRGGGSTGDLAAFDSYRLASHIAQFPLPVLTGIGHDKDRSVADMVAAMELKTPTAVAVWLGEGLTEFAEMLEGLEEEISAEAFAVLEREGLRLERLARVVSVGAVELTRRLEIRLERLSGELLRRGDEYFLRRRHRLAAFEAFFVERPGLFLTRAGERLTAMEQAVLSHRPENILSFGFAIVRADGQAVLDAATLTEGQQLDITLHKGKTKAKVYGKKTT